MYFLRKSTASQEIPLGPFVDSTDGNTQESGLTINASDIVLQKAGAAAEVAKNSGGATHLNNGRYYCVLDATDTDTVGPMRVSVHVTGALAVWLDCVVLDAAVYDVLFGSTAPSTITEAGVRTAVGLASANLDSQLETIDNLLDTEVAAIKAKTDNLPASPAATSDCLTAGDVRTAIGLASANLDTQLDALPTAAENASAVMASACDTGVSLAKVGEMLAALAAGKVTASSSSGVTTLTYKKRDGSTTSFTVVVTESDKTRATTGSLS